MNRRIGRKEFVDKMIRTIADPETRKFARAEYNRHIEEKQAQRALSRIKWNMAHRVG